MLVCWRERHKERERNKWFWMHAQFVKGRFGNQKLLIAVSGCFCCSFLMLMYFIQLWQNRNSRSEMWVSVHILCSTLTWKSIYTTLSGSCVYRRLLTVADIQYDKCTLIYRENNAVLCEPGTLKTGVTVIWTQAKFMCACSRGQAASEYVC